MLYIKSLSIFNSIKKFFFKIIQSSPRIVDMEHVLIKFDSDAIYEDEGSNKDVNIFNY